MKYLKISNKGLLNPEFFQLMGVSTKSTDPTKIGEHGTGLKYAICYFLRNNIDIKFFIGTKEIAIEKRTIDVKKLGQVDIVFINGKRTSLSLNYGKQWKAWEAVREIYCNALDEELIECTSVIEIDGKAKQTAFYIQINEDIQKLLDNWNHYFINETPLYEDEIVKIYPALEDKKLRIYKHGVLVEESSYYKSNFRFDFLSCPLNELRQYMGHMFIDIPTALFNSNSTVVKMFLEQYNQDTRDVSLYENTEEWLYARCDEEKKEIWKEFTYLHPDSAVSSADGVYKVPQGLFNKFADWCFSVEKVQQSSGFYGGGSYRDQAPVRIIKNNPFEDYLKAAIESELGEEEDDTMEFKLGMQFKGDRWDFTSYKEVNQTIYVFHIDLKHAEKQEIYAVVKIACAVHKGESIYNQLKSSILSNGQ